MKQNINTTLLSGKKAFLFRFIFYLLPNAKIRTRFLKKHKILGGMGEHVHWQPRFYPTDPYNLILHDNIAVAANVTFLMHDIINHVFTGILDKQIWGLKDCIEVEDNVFIGANSIICPGVKIGKNSIIAAGSVVVKDVEPGTIVGGNPAKKIGYFNDLLQKRLILSEKLEHLDKMQRINLAWKEFFEKHGDLT